MGFISHRCYLKLKESEGKKIRKVVYYLWENLKSEDDFKSLDWLEIVFQDETKLTLHYGVDNDGIELVDFDYETEKNKIETQFQDQATLVHENATLDKHWFPVLDEEIKKVIFQTKGEERLNNQFILEFTDSHMVEIFTKEEGMGVDFYE